MSRCELCDFAEKHGFFPSGVVDHCEKCHTTAKGRAELHCTRCCRSFGGEVAFNAHQANDSCRDPMLLMTRAKPGKPARHRFKAIIRNGHMVWVKADREEPFKPDQLTAAATKTDPGARGRSKAAVPATRRSELRIRVTLDAPDQLMLEGVA